MRLIIIGPAPAQIRGRHDMYNSAMAGCFAGGTLAYNTGPKGICFGCASFAAFSVAIDALTGGR